MSHSSSAGPIGDIAKQDATTTQDQRTGEVAANDATLNQFSGPVDQTPYYRSLVTTGRESTDQAYNNARSGMRANANNAGFGYTSPIAQGGDAAVRTAQAADVARVPGQAMQQATGPVLQAASTRAGEVSSLNPTGELSVAQQGYQYNNNSGLWQSLANLGMTGLQTGLKAASVGGFA